MIEPIFADTKFNRRIDRFLRRGRSAARSEWRLTNAAHNLLKLWRHFPRPGDRLSGRPRRRTTPAARHIAGRRRLRGNAPRHDFPQQPPCKAAVAEARTRMPFRLHATVPPTRR
jgi:hypothetical protein